MTPFDYRVAVIEACRTAFAEMQGHAPKELYEDGYSDACADCVNRIERIDLPHKFPEVEGDLARLRAALAEARKVIESLQKAIRPFSNAVFNDNGDMTVSPCHDSYRSFIDAYFVERKVRTFLERNPETKTIPKAVISLDTPHQPLPE